MFINRAPKRSHTLRYVLKNRATDTVLFVVLFTLYLKEDVDEDGNVKDGVEGGKPFGLRRDGEKERHEDAKNGVAGKENEKVQENGQETNEDDLD